MCHSRLPAFETEKGTRKRKQRFCEDLSGGSRGGRRCSGRRSVAGECHVVPTSARRAQAATRSTPGIVSQRATACDSSGLCPPMSSRRSSSNAILAAWIGFRLCPICAQQDETARHRTSQNVTPLLGKP